MAGSADITGTQYYIHGIGHPKVSADVQAPVVFETDPLTGGLGMPLPGTNTYVAAINTLPTLSSPYKLRKTQAALARVRAGIANMTVCCVGDSIEAGVSSQGNTSGGTIWTNAKATAWPTLLATLLNNAGLKASIDNVTSDNLTNTHLGTVPAYDPRVALGANWSYQALPVPGGFPIAAVAGSLGAAAAETLAFTPAGAFTSVDVYWYRSGSVGTFTIDIGGGVLGTQAAGANGVVKTTITGMADTTHTLNLIRTVLGSVLILGIVCYRSTAKSVNILNMGGSGMTSTQWNDSTGLYSPVPALGAYAPDLTIIKLGTNDWSNVNSFSAATTAANLTALVTKAQQTGDALLVVPPPSITSYASAANQATTISAIYAVGAAMSVPILDLTTRWDSYTVSNALGYFCTDGIHPIQIGQQDYAGAVAQIMLSA